MDTPRTDAARAWSFDELVAEGLSLVPAYSPLWTNHNPSDPGITLVELLAYFSEILVYRALRITPDAKLGFLGLLLGEPSSLETLDGLRGGPSALVEDAIRARVLALSRVQCAVTSRDFEQLAENAARAFLGVDVRAACVPGKVVIGGHRAREAPADVTVVLAPTRELPGPDMERLCRHVQAALAPCCMLTMRAHVVGPAYLHVFIGCRIAIEPGASLAETLEAVDAALQRRFGPAGAEEPGPDAMQFGRPMQLSEIAAIIDRTPDVDYVEDVYVRRMAAAGADSLVGMRIGIVSRLGEDTALGGLASATMRRLMRDQAGEVQSVQLRPWELVRVQLAGDAVEEIERGGGPDGGADGYGR